MNRLNEYTDVVAEHFAQRVASSEVSLKVFQRPAILAAIGVVATVALSLTVITLLLRTGDPSSVSDNAAVIGALIALGGVFTTQMVNTALENQRAEKAAELETQRAHEAALQKYLEQVGKLLIEHPKAVNFSMVARAQTLAVLKGLRGDSDRKRVLILFLSESPLIDKDNEGFLRLADLSDADLGGLGDGILSCKDLSEAHLERANLSATYLCCTDLTRAYLTDANLTGASLHKTDLEGVDLRKVKGLTQEQIDVACGNEDSILPDHLQRPAHWRYKGNKVQPKEG